MHKAVLIINNLFLYVLPFKRPSLRSLLLHLYVADSISVNFRELLSGSVIRHCCKKRSIGVKGVVATLSLSLWSNSIELVLCNCVVTPVHGYVMILSFSFSTLNMLCNACLYYVYVFYCIISKCNPFKVFFLIKQCVMASNVFLIYYWGRKLNSIQISEVTNKTNSILLLQMFIIK